MVIALGAIKSGRYSDAEADVLAVVNAAHEAAHAEDGSVQVKVILETALLTDAEKAVASIVAKRAGADFVKTSTGFAEGGATADDVALMRQIVGDQLGVKASGGVGSAAAVERMLAHGATRIGASGSVQIMEGASADGAY
jgi:deoxyribose-phosphate aldolase